MTTTREGTRIETGSKVARWYDEGAGWGYNRQALTVVRVNRVTVTVETEQGSRFRMNPADLIDRSGGHPTTTPLSQVRSCAVTHKRRATELAFMAEHRNETIRDCYREGNATLQQLADATGLTRQRIQQLVTEGKER